MKTCPSVPCEEGAQLLGVMTPGGLAYVRPPATVDADFAARARALGRPERRFRFSGPCVEGRCPQWTGERCAVADVVADSAAGRAVVQPGRLPACTIRGTCRWYAQRGPAACAACPLVVSDMGGTRTYRYGDVTAPGDPASP
ncbi:MAG TPA: hypothetical protein VLW53_15535 [Candidatus Eisenbacteria bacterium]|nr:hypothetical protein [Candidatus Eisenbacteria bacterium]